MNTLDAIASRRSIRRFKKDPVPRDLVARILASTVQAPSAGNGQPWRFVVFAGEHNDHLARLMQDRAALLREQGQDVGSLAATARAMAEAPLTVVVFATAPDERLPVELYEDWYWVAAQTIGGAIQTMLLAAQDAGVGSLWVCDILRVRDEVKEWLGRPRERMVAAVVLGYADEAPAARPRHPWEQVTQWWGE